MSGWVGGGFFKKLFSNSKARFTEHNLIIPSKVFAFT
jgi:hypothetical protein